MPKFKIETSLFEPVTIEVEGGRTYESVPLSDLLIREMSKLGEQRKARTLNDDEYVVQAVALIFGLKAEETETIDFRILNRMVELANDALNASKLGKIEEVSFPPPDMPPVDEAVAEKNAPKPEGGISQ